MLRFLTPEGESDCSTTISSAGSVMESASFLTPEGESDCSTRDLMVRGHRVQCGF